jgi:hypothetical protein
MERGLRHSCTVSQAVGREAVETCATKGLSTENKNTRAGGISSTFMVVELLPGNTAVVYLSFERLLTKTADSPKVLLKHRNQSRTGRLGPKRPFSPIHLS